MKKILHKYMHTKTQNLHKKMLSKKLDLLLKKIIGGSFKIVRLKACGRFWNNAG